MVDVLTRVGFTFTTNLCRAGILAPRLSHLLHHLELDGQPVAVPAGHVRHVFAAHVLELQDDVLERLVQRRADVHIPIGKRRPVMQHKRFFRLSMARAKLAVNILLIPPAQPLRFTLHQPGFHGKPGLRQVERVLVIHARQGRDAINGEKLCQMGVTFCG